ncbi:Re/Si-specific NAD(P)(+) transhydrogenase subunit alpha [Actinomycetospora lutea]|uniref:Re/Si-specific NAD(P)(+) transhydrogenase subunit alpha n=1 Tax=Actinomycetospora lutea TaxID=663604 RepID=UPI00236502CE|nr:Re/Si-specific NAD(P)(+) transhydrogenase subunit alpha [Actinomycetospora lutea]MDD7939249.1 Re/Si-specific NAD(P)(+) transhydrogenase subunit alpha [Actinomycetospora lutea]
MRIGVPRETGEHETRVAATPATVVGLINLGATVVVEPGAGELASFPDADYVAAGAELGDPWSADVVLALRTPDAARLDRMAAGTTLVAMVGLARHPAVLEDLAARGLTVLATDAVPRISRAQSLDVLSSMANIAGYRAVVEAAHRFGRFFTGQVTAAGKVPPATVLVAGAGVAGLAAIGAASSLGAVVRATDPRPEVAEQVRSLGGEFLAVEVEQEASSDGYARATSEAYDARAAEIYSEQAADVDVVVTTALIPGRPAPRLLTAADVASMKPGSVVVDMAAGQGGNVEGSVADEVVVTDNGVTIVGDTDLAARLPAQASQLYGTNLLNLLKLLVPEKDGRLVLDLEDVVIRSMTVTHHGDVLWPPPPIPVSAAHSAAGGVPVEPAASTPVVEPKRPMSPARRYGLVALAFALLFVATAFAPPELATNLTVFVLAVVIGYYVIGKVHHALHTPLMSVTNAISGVVVVGALLQFGQHGTVVSVLAFVAVLLASINIVGGFAVTRRMLAMFTKGSAQ